MNFHHSERITTKRQLAVVASCIMTLVIVEQMVLRLLTGMLL